MRKRFLFLDDDIIRHRRFAKLCNRLDVELDAVNNVDSCIYMLRLAEPYDCVFLDHDLDDTSHDETGQTVAEYIAYHLEPCQYPKNIVIHSHNPEGAKRMYQVITESTCIPTKCVEFS